MITKAVLDVSGAEHTIDWHWAHSGGDWWVEIEEFDGATPDLPDETRQRAQEACADAYPLAQYQDDCATDAEYYDRG